MKENFFLRKISTHILAFIFAMFCFFLILAFGDELKQTYSNSPPHLILDINAKHEKNGQLSSSFVPLSVATVVFAVDLDQTEFVPMSWRDLEKSVDPIFFDASNLKMRIVIASASYGLEGPNYTKKTAHKLLRKLYKKGILTISKKNSPITICFDFEAAQRIANGENLLTVVPSDGTLSFKMGYDKAHSFNIPVDELISSGYRLTDGTCQRNLYPNSESYKAAKLITDYNRFHKITKSPSKDMRHNILRTRLLSPADSKQNIMVIVVFALIIMVWSIFAIYRSPQSEIRCFILIFSTALIFWLYISVFKYIISYRPYFSRLLWYSFYIFTNGIPLSLLFVVTIFDKDKVDNKICVPPWLKFFAWMYPFVTFIIMTNDYTESVFKFANKDLNHDIYSYTPLFYIIMMYGFTMLITSLIILIYKSRKSPRRYASIFPSIVALTIIIYHVGYVTNVNILRDTNVTLIYCIQAILFLEALLSAKMIPSNTHYKTLLSMAPLRMRILDQNCNTIRSCTNAEELSGTLKYSILKNPGVNLYTSENIIIHNKKIIGGFAVWEEDVTLINQVYKAIERNVTNIEHTNRLLLEERNIKAKKISAEINAEIFGRLQKEIEAKVKKLIQASKELDSNEDSIQQFSQITMLLCNIKRHCNLFFSILQGTTINAYEFNVYLDELSEFAGYGNVKSLVRSDFSSEIRIKTAMLLYDFYFSLLEWSMKTSKATLICTLKKNRQFNFTIMSSEKIEGLKFSDKFLEQVEEEDGKLIFTRQEDSDTISLILSAEKEAKYENTL